MRSSFLDDRNFPLFFFGILLIGPAVAVIGVACTQPNTPEEKVAHDERFADSAREDMVTVSPRPGVECYILRGRHGTEPRVMSCVVLPVEIK